MSILFPDCYERLKSTLTYFCRVFYRSTLVTDLWLTYTSNIICISKVFDPEAYIILNGRSMSESMELSFVSCSVIVSCKFHFTFSSWIFFKAVTSGPTPQVAGSAAHITFGPVNCKYMSVSTSIWHWFFKLSPSMFSRLEDSSWFMLKMHQYTLAKHTVAARLLQNPTHVPRCSSTRCTCCYRLKVSTRRQNGSSIRPYFSA